MSDRFSGAASQVGPVGSGSGCVGRLRDAVDELVATDPSSLSEAALADTLLALRREMDRQEAVFARLASAGHVRGVGLADGAASTAAWLRHRAGMREGDARAAIESGAVCDLLPRTGADWCSGAISSGAARTIVAARVEGHDDRLVECEDALLELARAGDPATCDGPRTTSATSPGPTAGSRGCPTGCTSRRRTRTASSSRASSATWLRRRS